MNEEQVRLAHQRSSHAAKVALVDRDGPGDLGMRVLLRFRDGCFYIGHPGEMTARFTSGPDDATIWQVLATSIKLLWHNHGQVPATQLLVTTEGYMKVLPERTELEGYGHGDFQQEFAQNPDSDISEVLMTHVVDRAGISSCIEPYHYDDGGVIVFGELQVMTEQTEQGGAMADALRHVWQEVGT